MEITWNVRGAPAAVTDGSGILAFAVESPLNTTATLGVGDAIVCAATGASCAPITEARTHTATASDPEMRELIDALLKEPFGRA